MEATDYCFSFFRKPIQNIEPLRAIGIVDVYRYVVGHYAQAQTEALRSMTSPADVKKYKASHFDSFRKWIEVDYTCGFERMGTFTLFQGCCQLHPCYRVAKGGYVRERCGARLFPALRPTSIY